MSPRSVLRILLSAVAALVLPTAFLAPAAQAAGVTATATITASTPQALTIDVTGSGYSEEGPGIYVGVSESGQTSTPNSNIYRGATALGVDSLSGGNFATTLTLGADDIASLDSSKSYSVYTLKAGGEAASDPSQTTEVPLNIDFATLSEPDEPGDGESEPGDGDTDEPGDGSDDGDGEQEATTPKVTVSQTEFAVDGATTVTVTGTGFDPTLATGSRPPLAGRPSGVYVAVGKFAQEWEPSLGADSGARSAADVKWAVLAEDLAKIGGTERGGAVLGSDGTFSIDLTVEKSQIDELAAEIADGNYGVYTYPGGGADQPLYETYTPIAFGGDDGGSTGPGDGTGPTKPDSTTKGSLHWGVKASFRNYVLGPIANGSVEVSRGASASGNSYRFYQKSTSAAADGTGVTRYGGTIRFIGHGITMLTISDPTIKVTSATRGTLTVTVDGRSVQLANLNLAAAKKSTRNGAVTFTGATATLTGPGAAALNGGFGNYSAGESLDPVTFTIGANGGAASGSSTVATALVAPTFIPPSTPPSSSGLTIDGVQDGDELKPGDIVTASASGFEPNESGIAVVVYSTPVVLSQAVTADAQGNATWTGPLPGSLEPGEHTLTFQGSVDRGVTFTVAEDDDQINTCSVQDATLTWGVKEAWRAYVSGSIANGDWTTSGNASYETPEFTFSDGEGDFDAQASSGDVTFDGAIDFTGHHGALKVVLADPVVRVVDQDSAILMLDVTAGDREAAETGDASTTTTKGVPFAELDLSKATVERSGDGTTMTIDDAPATLTEQGHQVFSTYEAGADLDPIDLTVSTPADCATTPAVAARSDAASVVPAGEGDGNALVWWVAGAAALAAVLGGGIWLARRPGSA